jgi:hypothetical protein
VTHGIIEFLPKEETLYFRGPDENGPGARPLRAKSPPFIALLQSETGRSAWSGPTIAVGGIFPRRCEIFPKRMVRRQVTYGIGSPGIARKEEGLAPASTKILIAP